MYKDQIIYGLQDLISKKEVQEEGGVAILNDAIRLLNEQNYFIDDIGCPNCHHRDDLVCLGSVDNHKYYECKNCNAKIKVRIFNEIIDYEVK
ncbi:MAG: hypothetical protein K9K76_01230 [Halanaerobiales bacterium]|nr:hypothetical protein [Halanaerobiales bacterium]